MPRVAHFEIHAADVHRAVKFYEEVFGWTSQDWSKMASTTYYGLLSGADDEPGGINGAVMQRDGENMAPGDPIGGAVLTVLVEDFDATAAAVDKAGGSVAVAKHALGGTSWQGYFYDTENNVFGVHQVDPEAT
jgi:predicted enzyme related to lactoylglutathione lyase